jgi:trimeric autotransporter adhesin
VARAGAAPVLGISAFRAAVTGTAAMLACALALTAWLGWPAVRQSGTVAVRGTPATLSWTERGALSAAIGGAEPAYRFAGLTASNPAQSLRATFSRTGALISSRAGRLGITLTGYGNGQAIRRLPATAPRMRSDRITYTRAGVVEWWANGPLGLEQGFDLRAPPARGGQHVTLSLALSGDLRPRLNLDGAVLLSGARGALQYGGLQASDARGRPLPARFALRGRQLLIEVDARGARYPLRIDPFVQQAELTAAAGAANDELGSAVAGSDNTIVVGAPGAAGDGAVYVFVEPRGGWATTTAPTATLTATSATSLGTSVAIDSAADTIVVGDPGKDHVLVYSDATTGSWKSSSTPTAVLSSNDAGAGSNLGASVAIDAAGDTIVVGDPNQPTGGHTAAGAAYVFVKPTSGPWATTGKQSAELAPYDGAADGVFGTSVAVDPGGDAIAVGAPSECPACTAPGEAYLYLQGTTSTGTWENNGAGDLYPLADLTLSGGSADGDRLGGSVAIDADGRTVFAGAPGAQIGANADQGAVYVFDTLSRWTSRTQVAELTAPSGSADDELGDALGVSSDGDTVLAGAYGLLAVPEVPGASYLFAAPGAGWPTSTTSPIAVNDNLELTAADGAAGDTFGNAVAWAGDTAVIGAPFHTVDAHLSQGAAYLFAPVPTAAITTPANGARYANGATVDAAYSCAAPGSTISSCVGPVANGSRIDTSTAGTHTFTVTATTIDGEQASTASSYVVLAPALSKPVLTAVRQSHSRWREGKALAKISARRPAKPPLGTTFSFAINERATVKFSFTDKATGHKVRGKCVAQSKHNKHMRKCPRTVLAGTLSFTAHEGTEKLTFDGRLTSKRKLAPGGYKLTITATNANRRTSTPKSLTFAIVK